MKQMMVSDAVTDLVGTHDELMKTFGCSSERAWDVAEKLGYTNPQKAIRDHVDDEDKRGERIVHPSGGAQETIVINESGLYALVFGSKLPTAKKFKHWVTSEVLPQIRKTGSYGKPMSQVEILARLRLDNEEIRKEQKIQSSRIDTLNGVCTEGTKRQKLVAMVQAYAVKSGLTFREGWHRFRAAYNTAFHTSIGNLIAYYMKENGFKKKPGTPEYLEKKGLLDDALRIADKLLNGSVA